jgi:hypothetical protein
MDELLKGYRGSGTSLFRTYEIFVKSVRKTFHRMRRRVVQFGPRIASSF